MTYKESAIGISFGLLDTAEASRVTNIPIMTLESWRSRSRRKGPPFLKLSAGMVRYRLEDLKQWIDAHRVVPTDATSTGARVTT